MFMVTRWRRFVFVNISKMHEFAKDFSVLKCNNLRLNESDRFVTTVLVERSHRFEIQKISHLLQVTGDIS